MNLNYFYLFHLAAGNSSATEPIHSQASNHDDTASITQSTLIAAIAFRVADTSPDKTKSPHDRSELKNDNTGPNTNGMESALNQTQQPISQPASHSIMDSSAKTTKDTELNANVVNFELHSEHVTTDGTYSCHSLLPNKIRTNVVFLYLSK